MAPLKQRIDIRMGAGASNEALVRGLQNQQKGDGSEFLDIADQDRGDSAASTDAAFAGLYDMAGARRAKAKKNGAKVVGALAARRRIIERAQKMKEKRRSLRSPTIADRLNPDLGELNLGSLDDNETKLSSSSPKSPVGRKSPLSSPILGYGRRKQHEDNVNAKKREMKLKMIEKRGKSDGDTLLPQVEHVFTELKFGPNRLRQKRRRQSMQNDEPDRLPSRPMAPIMAYSTSSSIVVRWADAPSELARIDLYELEYNKSSNPLQWEPLAAVRHAAKSATIGNLPCYCAPLRFRVRAKSSIGWGPWSPNSEPMQTSPNRPARPSQISTGIVTTSSIEVLWPSPDDNGSKILYYTLFGCLLGGRFARLYRGKETRFVLGEQLSTSTKEKSVKKTGSQKKDDRNDEEEEEVANLVVLPGKTYLVKIVATNAIGDSVSSENVSLTAAESSTNDAMREQSQRGKKLLSSFGDSDQAKALGGIMSSWLHRSKELHRGADAVAGQSGRTCLRQHPLQVISGRPPTYHACALCDACGVEIYGARNAGHCEPCQYDLCPACMSSNGSGTSDRGSSAHSSGVQRGSRNSSWESKWQADMPTGPTRIAQLNNGWVECWDPASERLYYHNPRTDATQWEYPGGSLDEQREFPSATNMRRGSNLAARTDTSSSAFAGRKGRGSPALPDKDAPFRQKRFRFLWHVRGTPQGACKMLPVAVSRDNLVYKSYQALAHVDAETFRKKLRITYDDEVGIDSGGITKDWFLEISRALMDPRYALFRIGSNDGRYCLDARSGVNEQHLDYLHFFGRLMGKAIFDRHLLDTFFCKTIYKHMLGISPDLSDLKAMDPVYWESLQWVLKNPIDGCDVLENFSIIRHEFGELIEIELVPGGKNIPVTDENKHLYVEKLVAWECGGAVVEQMNAVRKGFFDLIPEEAVKVFTVEEFELLLNGKEDIDVDEMKGCSVFKGGYDVDSKPIQYFFDALRAMSAKDRGAVLRFITGTSKVPLDGFDPCFTITKASGGHGTDALPVSHTCFNQLVLPPYESAAQCQEKLLYASRESMGFHLT